MECAPIVPWSAPRRARQGTRPGVRPRDQASRALPFSAELSLTGRYRLICCGEHVSPAGIHVALHAANDPVREFGAQRASPGRDEHVAPTVVLDGAVGSGCRVLAKPLWVDPCGQFLALSGRHELPCLDNE